MPQNGSCTDITCDNEIKELYECHCCLYHLIEHVEIAKTIEILEEKQLTIEREQNLLEQAKQFLDESNISIDKLDNIFEKIYQVITSNCSSKN
ncbi:unnamed protein product [Rotaria sp. Silwood1]|nr:unnamed protein product [Rotaria sp. Silwood1]CAF1629630.1 unnamed protein product [Rotaria sp. Silwood1]CAF3799912.1 unnamed protein product [Rotaria sp. Silwood1]